jgi:DNA-binding transcriptional ArsR family regulator
MADGMRTTGDGVEQRIGPWMVRMTWAPELRGTGPTRVVIEPAEEVNPGELAGGVSQTIVRRINFGGAALEHVNQRRSLGKRSPLGMYGSLLRKEAQGRSVTPLYLALLSAVYIDRVESGEKSVTGKLAEITGKAPETIRQHLKQARREGMMTSLAHRAGGELSVKARAILEHE